jgi:hypothetical protein
MTYDCPTCQYAAHAHILKLQCLENRELCAIGNLDRCTAVCKLHVALKIPYVYDHLTKLCRSQAA